MNTAQLFLSKKEYFILNKSFVRKFGINTTLILSELIEIEELVSNKKKNNFFIIKLNTLSQQSTLSISKIKSSINKLYKIKFIDVNIEKHEKVYIKILHTNILKYFTNNINNLNIEIQNKKTQIIKNKKFKKPTKDELTVYLTEIGDKNQSEIMFDYYESKGWKVGKSPMKCWKSAARNWMRRLKSNENDFPNHYDVRLEKMLSNNLSQLLKYHNHLKQLGWQSSYSPTSGTTWIKKNK